MSNSRVWVSAHQSRVTFWLEFKRTFTIIQWMGVSRNQFFAKFLGAEGDKVMERFQNWIGACGPSMEGVSGGC